jgi:hypothetical protein
MKTKLAILSVVSLFLTACGGGTTDSAPAETNDVSVVAQNPADPANAGYYIDGILYTLVNGALEQQIDKSSDVLNKFKLLDFKASGDINADGTDDIAVVLINDAGGSGTFYYIGILTSGPTPIVENTSFLGDRIEVKGIEFVGNKFEVTYLDRDVETSFANPPTIEIVGIAEIDESNSSFNFTCRDSVGICL